MSRHLTAFTSVAAAKQTANFSKQSIFAASQNGGGGLEPCPLGRDSLPQRRRVQYLRVPIVIPGSDVLEARRRELVLVESACYMAKNNP